MADDKSPAPFASDSVPWTEWSDVPRFGVRYRHLSLAALGETYHVGVAIEELPAGKQTSPAHYHISRRSMSSSSRGRSPRMSAMPPMS
ncbi:hypothetical protein [Mesorhizobium sp. M0491]|uniref:hypothetical protein n=1 Tax=Mesorhizobium sp. M0491 TaxID=2956950 RepID=UPI00333724EA